MLLGIEIGGTKLQLVLGDKRGKISRRQRLSIDIRKGAKGIRAQIEDALKKIESERAENARAQSDAIGKLEQEKKPTVQRRDEAKHAANICERELAGVEARLQANDSTDRK